MLHKKINRPR